VDREFRAELAQRFKRYAGQFMPVTRARPLEVVKPLAEKSPRDANLAFEFAMALLRAGEPENAVIQAERALSLEPKHAQARYLIARAALAGSNAKKAEATLREMTKDGQAGYAVRLALGELARARGDVASARTEFELAEAADPTQAEPVSALAELAAGEKVTEEEVRHLTRLARLSEHAPLVHRRLLGKLIELKRFDAAVEAGKAAIWADIDGLLTHVLYAEALAETGKLELARFELETAVLCRGEPSDRADAHVRLAEVLLKMKLRGEARGHLEAAKKLDPNNARAKTLRL
jgi:tetratricopeptide (TPR) repeat protein